MEEKIEKIWSSEQIKKLESLISKPKQIEEQTEELKETKKSK
jgi:hypothetical protein